MNGKRVIVLGGTSGIGLTTAKAAQREGASIVVPSSRRQRVDSAVSALRGKAEGEVVELERPRRYSAADIGRALAAALGREVCMEPVPRETWEKLLRSQGMKNPMPRIRMVDGFNEGWIDFERAGEHRRGTVTLETVIVGLTSKGDTA